MDEQLKNKLNEMFDIEGATICKTQYCPVGRWVFTLCMTLFFAAVYGVCMWGVRLFYGSLYVFLIVLLTAIFAFLLVRLWLGFIVDVQGKSFAERTVFLRHEESRYYYTVGRHVKKFEYDGGFVAAAGKVYEKFEDKTDYSPLAGRYDRALQRRSSAYATLTPAFWFDVLRAMQYTVTDTGVCARSSDGTAQLLCDENGKICRIDYFGKSDYLYDSLSPIKIFDAKLPGKYRISYTFTTGEQPPLTVPSVFEDAIRDYLWQMPPADVCRFETEE